MLCKTGAVFARVLARGQRSRGIFRAVVSYLGSSFMTFANPGLPRAFARAALFLAVFGAAAPGRAQTVGAARELPLKRAPQPTTADITPADLMTRLYIFADDSMMGREVGSEGHLKSTAYIEREVRRLGLVPAGDSGGYF